MDKRIREYTDAYVEKLRTAKEYLDYSRELQNIRSYPDLMDKINYYREENFVIQNTYEGDELYDKLEEFEKKHEKFLENAVVSDFLNAETAFVHLLQEVNTHIIEGLNFQ